MEVESAGDILCDRRVDGFGHLQYFGIPVVLPSRLSPKQAFVTDSEYHYNKLIILIFNLT